MAGPLIEREEERKKAVLPTIRREQHELHSALDALGRGAAHIHTPPEGTYRNVEEAGRVTRIVANVQSFLQEGSAPLYTRFLRMLSP